MSPYFLRNDEAGLAEAAAILRSGGLVAIPTETVYGLAADALSSSACAKIFSLKRRPSNDPLIVHISAVSQLGAITFISAGIEAIVNALTVSFWPGPLTLVLAAKPGVPSIVTAGGPTVGVRMPSHPVARAIIDLVGRPLAAPSANIFGSISPTAAADVAAEFPDSDLPIVDGEACDVGIESTVLLVTDSCLTILRRGQVTEAMLIAALNSYGLGHVSLKVQALSTSEVSADTLSSPGQFIRHYSPQTLCYLLTDKFPTLPGAVLTRLSAHLEGEGRVVVLNCNPAFSGFTADSYTDYLANIIPRETSLEIMCAYDEPTLEGVARGLFGALRRADARRPEYILILPPEPAPGLASALIDRLFRAVSGRWVSK